jgi:hypothetical protein
VNSLGVQVNDGGMIAAQISRPWPFLVFDDIQFSVSQ